MSRRKDRRNSNNPFLSGSQVVRNDDDETVAVYFHRTRKARRAQARVDQKNWRELTQDERWQL